MTDPVFFTPAREFTVGEIADLTGAEIQESSDNLQLVRTVSSIKDAGEGSLTFAEDRSARHALAKLRACAVFCAHDLYEQVPDGVVGLKTTHPKRAFAQIARILHPDAVKPTAISGSNGISKHAHVNEDVDIEDGVTVEVGAVIGKGASIGRGTTIGPNTVIGKGCRVGRDCYIAAGCGINATLIGDRVIVHGGAQIGFDGFGFVPGDNGVEKIPQLGRVIIQDDVEIGTNVSIDRGTFSDTVIGAGSKIDNLVQIGHNVVMGRNCLIAGQCGISGSVTLGDNVVLAGQVGIKDHVTLGNNVQIGARSGVASDIADNEIWMGAPAQPKDEFLRSLMIWRRLTRPKSKGSTNG